MATVFTGPERRKKVVTYGRQARLSNASIFTEDPPSPERPRKQAGKLQSTAQPSGTTWRTQSALEAPRVTRQKSAPPRDEFDVPSDNEPTPRAARSKKPLPKPAPKPVPKPVDIDLFDVPSSGDELATDQQKKGKPDQLPRKANSARLRAPVHTRTLSNKKQDVTVSSDDPLATAPPAARTRATTPSAAPKPTVQKASKQSAPASKANLKKTTPDPQVVIKKKTKPALARPVKETIPTPSAGPASDLGVFDVPSSDEDARARTPVRPRPAPVSRAKAPSKPPITQKPVSREPSAESDASNASHKRKRRASVSSVTTTQKSDATQKQREMSVARRSKKYQKKEDSVSPGHIQTQHPQSNLTETLEDPPLNKPKRTRTRTVPVISRPPYSKAQSSPGKLHEMLAMRSMPQPSAVQEMPKAPAVEDETMYDIQEVATPLARTAKPTIAGSVTPRQRALFSDLLGGSPDLATPMPCMSKLQLTDRRPASVLASLTRSSSDIPQTAYSRKGRLIDMLKQAAPSSDEESESDGDSEEDITETSAASAAPSLAAANNEVTSQIVSDEMIVDTDTQTSSHASQATMLMQGGAKVTYGQQRSYLEVTNLEDGLMDWDDDIEAGPVYRQGSVTESEEDSQQVVGIDVLRKKGQHYKFEAETQAIIEDISGKSNMNISGRRSAVMELASQMAEKSFVEQLLESALTSSLLRGLSATGDLVFDFAAAVAVLFMIRTKPGYAVVDQIYQCGILTTIRKLLSSTQSNFDIVRISKDRKTNMAPSAREIVVEFRALVLKTCEWPAHDIEKLSPQLIASKLLEELVIGLRKSGNGEPLVDEDMVVKLLDAASGPSQRLKSCKATSQDRLTLDMMFSTLESLSISREGQASWPNEILGRLADMMSASLDTTTSSPIRLVIRLCMNLSNSRPKACQIFADENFVTRLTRFIIKCFQLLGEDKGQDQTAEVREDLILGLGAMINLAEFSDQARLNVVQKGDALLDELVEIFLEGSERADRADSVEESQSSVIIGYLTILLGNLCLNDQIRRKAILHLPGNNIDMLVQKVKEFVLYNQRLDRLTSEFDGVEGRETLKNFTMRLMLVVERLEQAGP